MWLALQFGPSTFGVFDAFADEAGREAHLSGPIARALGANASRLLAHAGVTTKPQKFALEVDVIPVSDVEQSKRFYQRLGWRLDQDASPAKDVRIVQFTPPAKERKVHES